MGDPSQFPGDDFRIGTRNWARRVRLSEETGAEPGSVLTVGADGTVSAQAPSGGGGGGVLPGVEADGEDSQANPFGDPGTYEWATYDEDATVMAWGLTGDAFPRVVVRVDPTNYQVLNFGDGTYDPLAAGAAIALGGDGTLRLNGHAGAGVQVITLKVIHDLTFPAAGDSVVIKSVDTGNAPMKIRTHDDGTVTCVPA